MLLPIFVKYIYTRGWHKIYHIMMYDKTIKQKLKKLYYNIYRYTNIMLYILYLIFM